MNHEQQKAVISRVPVSKESICSIEIPWNTTNQGSRVWKFQQIKSYWKSKVAPNSPPVYSLRGILAYDKLQKLLQPSRANLDSYKTVSC